MYNRFASLPSLRTTEGGEAKGCRPYVCKYRTFFEEAGNDTYLSAGKGQTLLARPLVHRSVNTTHAIKTTNHCTKPSVG
ncbi:MAG TPA: hypothetical protein VI461_04140 [Chitinophagaceae bacterium]|nr:hypothetical protein [Chitinophagaceae bacterium]